MNGTQSRRYWRVRPSATAGTSRIRKYRSDEMCTPFVRTSVASAARYAATSTAIRRAVQIDGAVRGRREAWTGAR